MAPCTNSANRLVDFLLAGWSTVGRGVRPLEGGVLGFVKEFKDVKSIKNRLIEIAGESG